jgi:hypothetical protein
MTKKEREIYELRKRMAEEDPNHQPWVETRIIVSDLFVKRKNQSAIYGLSFAVRYWVLDTPF